MIIRPMTMEDCKKVAEIDAATFSDAWSYEVFVGCLLQDNYHMMVAVDSEDTEDIWGYFSYYTVLDEGDIGNVCVRADKRRMGVADKMMDCMLAMGKAQGLTVFFFRGQGRKCPCHTFV